MSGLAAALAGAKLRRVQRVSIVGPRGWVEEDEAGGPFLPGGAAPPSPTRRRLLPPQSQFPGSQENWGGTG